VERGALGSWGVFIQRRSIRLSDYDYTFTGMYFLTICTHDKKCLFVDFVDGKVRLNQIGQFIWHEIPNHFSQTELDAFVVARSYSWNRNY
jgi:hypothetical protein